MDVRRDDPAHKLESGLQVLDPRVVDADAVFEFSPGRLVLPKGPEDPGVVFDFPARLVAVLLGDQLERVDPGIVLEHGSAGRQGQGRVLVPKLQREMDCQPDALSFADQVRQPVHGPPAFFLGLIVEGFDGRNAVDLLIADDSFQERIIGDVMALAVKKVTGQRRTPFEGGRVPLAGVAVEGDGVHPQAGQITDVFLGFFERVGRDVHGEVDMLADAAPVYRGPDDPAESAEVFEPDHFGQDRTGDVEAESRFFEHRVGRVQNSHRGRPSEFDGRASARSGLRNVADGKGEVLHHPVDAQIDDPSGAVGSAVVVHGVFFSQKGVQLVDGKGQDGIRGVAPDDKPRRPRGGTSDQNDEQGAERRPAESFR